MNIQDKNDVRKLVIEACTELNYSLFDLATPPAIELLMGTWAAESSGGANLVQLGGGPARSAWQIEKPTFEDVIKRCGMIPREVISFTAGVHPITAMDYPKIERNHKLAIQIARLKYFLIAEKIPENMTGQARYWKKYYNTELGAGTVEKYIELYQTYAL